MHSCQISMGHKIQFLLISFMLLMLAGCGEDKKITKSFNDLLYESEKIDKHVLDHHGVLSIAGLLPIAETGTLYHYPAGQKPATAIGLSRRKSFRLEGTVELDPDVTIAELCKIRDGLEEIGRLTENAIELLIKKAKTQYDYDNSDPNSNKPEIKLSKGERDKLKIDLELEKIQIAKIDARLKKVIKDVEEIRRKKGVMIVNWNVGSSGEGGIVAKLFAQVRGKKSHEFGGFTVLGGIRISCLFLGSDFKDFYLNLKEEEQNLFKTVGVVTYTLQANNVIYGNQLKESRTLAGYLELNKELIKDPKLIWKGPDSIKLDFYFQQISQLNNSGTLGSINWEKENVDFLFGEEFEHDDQKGIEDNEDERFVRSDGWLTIHAILTYANKIYKEWDKIPTGEYFYLSRPEPYNYPDWSQKAKDLYWRWYESTLKANESLRDASNLKNLPEIKKGLRKLNNAIEILNIRLNKRTIANEKEFIDKVGTLLEAIYMINRYVQVPSDWRDMSEGSGDEQEEIGTAITDAYNELVRIDGIKENTDDTYWYFSFWED